MQEIIQEITLLKVITYGLQNIREANLVTDSLAKFAVRDMSYFCGNFCSLPPVGMFSLA